MPTRIQRRLRRAIKSAGNAVIGTLAVLMLNGLRRLPPDFTSDLAAWVMRKAGLLLRENKIGRDNLARAFPEKPPEEIEIILRGVWDNLGRVGAEFAHLDRLWDFDPADLGKRGRIEFSPEGIERFLKLANDGKPALIFAAHLANWELPAIAAAANGIDSSVLYRRPNIGGIDRWLRETRAANMGALIPTGLMAPAALAGALGRGSHVGMLIDQYYRAGVGVNFFGQPTTVNPLLARLAQHVDCPIHGVRVIRLPGHRLRAEITEQIEPARGADGKVDIAGTMQIVTNVIEGWIREHPEQWLWLHRRWRPEDQASLKAARAEQN